MPRLGAGGTEYQHRKRWGVSGEGRLEPSWVGHRWGGWDLKHVDMGSSNKLFEQHELSWASRPVTLYLTKSFRRGELAQSQTKHSFLGWGMEGEAARGEQGARASFPGTCSPWPFIYLRGVGHTEPKKLLKRKHITHPEPFHPVHLKAHPLHSRMFFKWPLLSKVPVWTQTVTTWVPSLVTLPKPSRSHNQLKPAVIFCG